MTAGIQTYTTVERLFATPRCGLARVATRCTDGGYDSPHKTVVDAWCVFDADSPSRFNHFPSFDDAMERIREHADDFAAAAVSEPASLANALARGYELGRVISPTALWTDTPGIALNIHSPRVAAGELRFSVFTSSGSSFDIVTPPNISRYTYSLATAKLLATETVEYKTGG